MNDNSEEQRMAAGLPPGSQIQGIAFVGEPTPGQAVLWEGPAPVNRRAVLVGERGAGRPWPDADLLALSIPLTAPEDTAPDVVARAREWCNPSDEGDRPTQVVTLQGAQVVWAPGRVAVLAPPDRLDAVRRAAVEAAFYDGELRALERELGGLWPDMEADSPLAFEFNERSVPRRRQLAQRYVRVLTLRATLARITPHVLCPHVHPPTLASQVGERLRERARMAHRVESLAGQVEVFERVYEACGQRASDYMLARNGHTLEWVIIILLLAQTILVGIDLLSATGK